MAVFEKVQETEDNLKTVGDLVAYVEEKTK